MKNGGGLRFSNSGWSGRLAAELGGKHGGELANWTGEGATSWLAVPEEFLALPRKHGTPWDTRNENFWAAGMAEKGRFVPSHTLEACIWVGPWLAGYEFH